MVSCAWTETGEGRRGLKRSASRTRLPAPSQLDPLLYVRRQRRRVGDAAGTVWHRLRGRRARPHVAGGEPQQQVLLDLQRGLTRGAGRVVRHVPRRKHQQQLLGSLLPSGRLRDAPACADATRGPVVPAWRRRDLRCAGRRQHGDFGLPRAHRGGCRRQRVLLEPADGVARAVHVLRRELSLLLLTRRRDGAGGASLRGNGLPPGLRRHRHCAAARVAHDLPVLVRRARYFHALADRVSHAVELRIGAGNKLTERVAARHALVVSLAVCVSVAAPDAQPGLDAI